MRIVNIHQQRIPLVHRQAKLFLILKGGGHGNFDNNFFVPVLGWCSNKKILLHD